MQHYWIDRYLNDQHNGIWMIEGATELTETMNDLIDAAGKELNVETVEYHMYETCTIRNNTYGNIIRYEVNPGYTEAQMIAAGLIDPSGIQLDPNVWGDMFKGESPDEAGVPYD
jgi:hypothetical protein